MRTPVLFCLALATLVGPLGAQIPDLPTITENWMEVGYPKLFYTTRDGLTGGIHYAQFRPPGWDDWEDPPPYRASLTLDGQISTSGSKHLGFFARMPNLVRGWRFNFSVKAQRRARVDYFGLGNTTPYDDNNVTETLQYYYRADFRRLFVRGEVQKTVKSRLRVLVGFHAERWRLDTLPGPSALAIQSAAGLDIPVGSYTADVSTRFGLVFDTRNSEVAPTKGVLLQTIFGVADSNIAGALSYTRTTVSGAAFLSPSERITFAGRVVGQVMTGSPGFGSYVLIEASDEPFEGLGGYNSHRGLAPLRFVGEDLLLANMETRWTVTGMPGVLTISLLGFVDVGRVFHPGGDTFRLTTEGMHVGAGIGPVISVRTDGIVGLTIAAGPDGPRIHAMTGWAF